MAMAAACTTEKGDLTLIIYSSLSFRPKINASGYSSFYKMKFLIEGMPAIPLKSSLKQ